MASAAFTKEFGMSARFRRLTGPVGALLLALCCLVTGGWRMASAESNAPSERRGVVRRYEVGRLWATPNDGPGVTMHFTLSTADGQQHE